MTLDTGTQRGGSFVTRYWPWLLGAGMLAVYLITLERLPTPYNLDRLAELSGWSWRPKFYGPLTFLITAPLGWLPAGSQLLAMNVLNAVFASLLLVWLARTVALLPHDRTNEQRLRIANEDALLGIPTAWLPPLFAVLVCGLQLSFWENAVDFRKRNGIDAGEMLNLLLFAYVIRCLMEFRVRQRDSWLYRASLVVGLGMANHAGMMGYVPAFVVAVVWLKGFDFFEWRFLVKMLALGLAGLSLLLFFPIQHGLMESPGWPYFRAVLHTILSTYKEELWHPGFDKRLVLELAITSLVPMLLIGIRWTSSFGDSTPLGIFIASSIFNLAHAFLLLACLWVALDGPFSPRQLVTQASLAVWPMLSFYYLGAIGVGYFSGYFLLVYGAKPVKARPQPPGLVKWLRGGVVAFVWLLAVAEPVALVSRNLPVLQAYQETVRHLSVFFSSISGKLPPQAVVLLSDEPTMVYHMLATEAREHRGAKDLLIDTGGLAGNSLYLERLKQSNPDYGLAKLLSNTPAGRALSSSNCVHLLEQLAEQHPIYYLHPSYGYYFERFYPEPHGLVSQMRLCDTNTWEVPPAPEAVVAENLAFWQSESNELAEVERAAAPAPAAAEPDAWQKFQEFAKLGQENNFLARYLCHYYSRALDAWGVVLDEHGRNEAAGRCYTQACALNPDNLAARMNQDFSGETLKGRKPALRPVHAIEEQLGGYHTWLEVMAGGPVHDPSYRDVLAVNLLAGFNYRQAMMQFEQERALLPDEILVPLKLAQANLYAYNRPHDLSVYYPTGVQILSNAVAAADQALAMSPTNLNALFSRACALYQLADCVRTTNAYETPVAAFDHLLALQPDNLSFHLIRGEVYTKMDRLPEARKDYETVLAAAPQEFRASYSLGDITYRQEDWPASFKYYESFISNMPSEFKGSQELRIVNQRLDDLRKKLQ